ncbi:hypothetical protein [Treponema zioleckii]|uniref:hypothetical protein n=1 Tax=Treponema zioleckii TaxID=331680 RepID=UPI00168C0795|nr:hypothetical protein [Treponema zioleckii]
MKKILSLIATAAISISAFAGDFRNNLTFGLQIPVESVQFEADWIDTVNKYGSKLGVTLDDQFSQKGGYVSFGYLGTDLNSGFTLKADLQAGIKWRPEHMNWLRGSKLGYGVALNLGAGYSFVRSEKYTLAVTGNFGIDFSSFDSKVSLDIGSKSYGLGDISETQILYNAGTDISGIYHVTSHFGLFANLGIRYIFGGKINFSGYGSTSDDTTSQINFGDLDVSGTYAIIPTLGLCITF